MVKNSDSTGCSIAAIAAVPEDPTKLWGDILDLMGKLLFQNMWKHSCSLLFLLMSKQILHKKHRQVASGARVWSDPPPFHNKRTLRKKHTCYLWLFFSMVAIIEQVNMVLIFQWLLFPNKIVSNGCHLHPMKCSLGLRTVGIERIVRALPTLFIRVIAWLPSDWIWLVGQGIDSVCL